MLKGLLLPEPEDSIFVDIVEVATELLMRTLLSVTFYIPSVLSCLFMLKNQGKYFTNIRERIYENYLRSYCFKNYHSDLLGNI